MSSWIRIVVLGKPQPAGSKTAMPIRRKDGSYVTRANGAPVTAVVDSNRKSGSWKQEVKALARKAMRGAPMEGEMEVTMRFVRARPKTHYGSGKNSGVVKPNAPKYPTMKPDALKLARAVEDALTGVVYRDDSQTVDLKIYKRWGCFDRVVIKIREKQRDAGIVRGTKTKSGSARKAQKKANSHKKRTKGLQVSAC